MVELNEILKKQVFITGNLPTWDEKDNHYEKLRGYEDLLTQSNLEHLVEWYFRMNELTKPAFGNCKSQGC